MSRSISETLLDFEITKVDCIFMASKKSKESQREKIPSNICDNVDSNQTAHSRSLIRVFVVRMKKRCTLGFPK